MPKNKQKAARQQQKKRAKTAVKKRKSVVRKHAGILRRQNKLDAKIKAGTAKKKEAPKAAEANT
jgi:hypothetical protein